MTDGLFPPLSPPTNIVAQLTQQQPGAAATPNEQLATGPTSLAAQEQERLASAAIADRREVGRIQRMQLEQRSIDRINIVWSYTEQWKQSLAKASSSDPNSTGVTVPAALIGGAIGAGYRVFKAPAETGFWDLVAKGAGGGLIGAILVGGAVYGICQLIPDRPATPMPVNMPIQIERDILQKHSVSYERMLLLKDIWAEMANEYNGTLQPPVSTQMAPLALAAISALKK
jgi:hypothetical protein